MDFQMDNPVQTETVLPRLLTKLVPPRLKQTVLPREHLLHFLVEKRDVKLIIISAPAGYGKTTLLAEYVRHKFKPCCWLSLDQSDRDPAMMLENLVRTIGRIFPDFLAPAQLLSNLIQALNSPNNGVEVCTRLLINQIYSTIQEDFVLILDDYHLIEDVTQINKLISLFLNYLPDNCQVLLSCRAISPLELSSLLLRGEVVGIGLNDLKMTPAEVYTLLSEKLALPVSEEDATLLAQRTEGWIAGILLGSSKILRSRSHSLVFSSQEQLFAYIATEMFQRLPESLQRFLLETSVLEVLEPGFCDRLLDTNDSRERIRECNRRQLLVHQLEDQLTKDPKSNSTETFYRYHNLLRQFLIEQLKQNLPARYVELHHRAASLYKEQGDMVRLVTHLLQAQAYEDVATYLLTKSTDQLKAGHSQTVKNWLEALPAELFKMRPDLMLLKAQVLGLNGCYQEAHILMDVLEGQLANESEASQLLRVKTTTLKARLLRVETRYESAIEVLRKSLTSVEKLSNQYEVSTISKDGDEIAPDLLEVDIFSSIAENYLELGMSLGMDGNYAQALVSLEAARNYFNRVSIKERLAHVHHCLSLTFKGLNDREAQKLHLEKSLLYWKEAGSLPGQVNTMVLLAEFLLDNLELKHASQILDQALERTAQAQYYYGQAYVLSYKGDLSREQNRLTEAYEYYYKAKELAQLSNDKRLALLLCNEMAVTSRMMGDLQSASTVLNQAFEVLETEDYTSNKYILEMLRLGQIGLELDRENPVEAKKLLEEPFVAILSTKFRREYALKLFLEARLLYTLGKYNPALENLKEALGLTSQLGKRSFLRQEALNTLPLLQFSSARLSHSPDSIRQALTYLLNAVTETLSSIGKPNPLDQATLESSQLHLKKEPVKPLSYPITKVKPLAGLIEPDDLKNVERALALPGPEPLVARAFGSMEVYVHGTPIKDWRTVKAWELLFLLLEENKPMRKETIIDLLWPDLLFGQADNLFRSTFHRLRKAVSPDWITREGNLYSLKVSCWYDVEQFKKFIALGDKLSLKKDSKTQALEYYQSATRLYSGNFLDALYSNWAVERQEILSSLWVQTLLKEAELELELGQPKQALATLEICLAQDKCNDAVTLMQLRVCRHMRSSSLLTQSYQLYCQNLKKELNLNPSSEINTFYTTSLKELNAS